MRFVLFYHSLVSDWNHGNAHFLRGIAAELLERGHRVDIFEPANGWSLQNLRASFGEAPLKAFANAYPTLTSTSYHHLNLKKVLADADVVIVHEWNNPELVAAIGAERQFAGFTLFFHDTHHRAVTARAQMQAYDLRFYDGVLAYGRILTELYLQVGWTRRAWTWHEAADIRIFRPLPEIRQTEDVVWIGNWGDDERDAELSEFFIQPVKALGCKAAAYGVRYPAEALEHLADAGIGFRGWVPNFQVPQVFATARVTVHIPRRPYVQALPGIPTIRPFEALACGIPLVTSPWLDSEGLFTAGKDYALARSGKEMTQYLGAALADPRSARERAANGLKTIRARHTCAHRVDQLLEICEGLAQ
ncbi:MAG: glycosyltransferase [Verrucomicrobia bacterium]|nr:glycosyltransferase [Verrucomicrobiota bacterium]